MLIRTIRFEPKQDSGWFVCDPCSRSRCRLRARGWLCPSGLCEYFDVPEDAKTLWANLYTRPGADRVKIHLVERTPSLTFMHPVLVDGQHETLYYITVAILRKILGKRTIVYVGIEYE